MSPTIQTNRMSRNSFDPKLTKILDHHFKLISLTFTYWNEISRAKKVIGFWRFSVWSGSICRQTHCVVLTFLDIENHCQLIGLASLDRIRSYLVTKSISDTHGESTQVSILDRGRSNLASLSGAVPMDQCINTATGYLCLTNLSGAISRNWNWTRMFQPWHGRPNIF